ncbi:TSCPD domain-containing protein [Bradyrhizobium ottawaense]
MTNRRVLPQRRRAETFEIAWGGFDRCFAVTLGFYPDGAVGEVFITGGKSGQEIEAIARDGAVAVSLALQYGAPIDSLVSAITRDERGNPSSIIGAVLDRLAPQGSQTPLDESQPVRSERRADGATGRGPVASSPTDHQGESNG